MKIDNRATSALLHSYCTASSKALDHLLDSWNLEGIDKEIALLKYKKGCIERRKIIQKLNNYLHQ